MDKRMLLKIDECLDELCLTTARKRYHLFAQKARKESLDYEEYLFLVLRDETEERRIKRVDRFLKQSCIPLEKSLGTFELKRLPNIVRHLVNTVLEGEFLERRENILIFGNPGSGKTHLVCAIGQELIRKDKRVYFTTCAMLLQQLLAAKRDLRLPKLFKRLNRYHALIIDDIGYVQQDKDEMGVLFTLLAERYERGSVMITSNLAFSKWEMIFKDPVMTAAAIDRIVHHSIILELNIPSYRVSQAKKKHSSQRKTTL